MSNLYKTWFVRSETTKARVIDSDAIMAECLEKSAGKAFKEQGADLRGFSEGIAAESAEHIIKAEDVDYVQQAKEEAERILEEAKQKADAVMHGAAEEAEEIRRTAEEEGYREGHAHLDRELEQAKTELEDEYCQKKSVLEDEYRQKMRDMEKDLVDVILEVFNKVFHIQFDSKREILMYLIENAILNIEGEKKFRIKVSESNVLFLENNKEDILDRVGHDIELELLSDSTLEGNDCVIETDSGVFDCGLGVQLENLIKDIRSLSL